MPPGSPDAGLVPAQGYNQEKVSVSVVWSFLFVSEKLPRRLWDPDSSTRRTGGLRRRRGQGWRRWAVPGAAQGRQADKAPPVPPPRPRSKREGSEGQRGGMEREVGEGEEDRRRALPAGLGWSAQKREGREEGPRRAGRREGFLKPKINKLFLFTCGVGGGASSAASPPPRRLFVTARAPGDTGTTPGAPGSGTCAMHRKHTERASGARLHAADGGAVEKRGRAPWRWLLPGPRTRRYLSQASCLTPPPPPPLLKRKAANPREEIRERIPPSGLGVGSAPSSS